MEFTSPAVHLHPQPSPPSASSGHHRELHNYQPELTSFVPPSPPKTPPPPRTTPSSITDIPTTKLHGTTPYHTHTHSLSLSLSLSLSPSSDSPLSNKLHPSISILFGFSARF
ncbi:hypothetical protein RHMOL_Rhmol09G0141200 [Rhododendron molle]|uniref:Uncharacterized protein n=1 Tax=Rhododendron molle TaxID=49168 RepID=A0ACC0MED6_RHOML|nr:hypothetical protein RHMOL_Rhmol09G0141200 [Rhododendron molle]